MIEKSNKQMEGYIQGFANQLERGLDIGSDLDLEISDSTVRNVVITGVGGSAIGASVTQNVLYGDLYVPCTVNKGYHLPGFVTERTLVIAVSYSGNTEETLSALNEAIDKKAQIVCITSGGAMKKICEQNGLNCIEIPNGQPPRTALLYSLSQIFWVIYRYGLIGKQPILDLEESIGFLRANEGSIKKLSRNIASKLVGKLPVLYGHRKLEAALIRFRQQLNENSKTLGWINVLPEMNHNELVGWSRQYPNLFVLMFRLPDDALRINKRFDYVHDVIKNLDNQSKVIEVKGSNLIEQTLFCILLGDWISLELAQNQSIDSIEISVIDNLKEQLATINE